MGRNSLHTKESILESLLEAYDSGIPLRIKEMKSAGRGDILSAINRHKHKSKQLIFFEGLRDAREKLAIYVTETLEDAQKAEHIREYNKPRKRKKYSKKAIVLGLLGHFDEGGELTGDVLQKTWMHNAIYYKLGNRVKTYGSLFDAREALAVFLDSKNRPDDALRVRKYNEPIERKMSEKERESHRTELLQQLHKKIGLGENLGHRAQQRIDRKFVNACSEYFGTYSEIFRAAGVDYTKFANRPLNKTPEEYFVLFLDLIESASTLQRGRLEEINYNLMGRINKYESGYFSAIEKARTYYAGKMEFDMVRYIDDFLFSDEKSSRDVIAKENAIRRQKLTKSILFFDNKTYYTIPDDSFISKTFSGIKERMTGKEIMELALISEEWLESIPFSEKMYMERSNIKNLFHTYPDRILKFGFGKQQKYLFHSSIIDDEQRQGKIFDRVVAQELEKSSESSAQRRYFRDIIIPKLNVRLKDKSEYSPEEIRWWIYEFGGIRVVESYVEKNTKTWTSSEKERAIKEMHELIRDCSRNKEDNIYMRLQKILSKDNVSKDSIEP